MKEDPHTAYKADCDFLVLEVTSCVIAASYKVLGLTSRADKPKIFPIPEDINEWSKLKKLQFLHKAAAKIVDEMVVDKEMMDASIKTKISLQELQEIHNQMELNEDRRFPCRFPGCLLSFKYNGKSRKKHEMKHDPPVEVPVVQQSMMATNPASTSLPKGPDDIFNYNTALMAEGLYCLNFLDAVSEGDGIRIIRQYKYLMLLCKADRSHSVKYALECLYQLLLVNGTLSKRESEIFTWNRSVNNHGGVGRNIPLDIEVEHSNKHVKEGIRNLVVNVTEPAITRIAKAERSVRGIVDKVDKSLHRAICSGKPSINLSTADLDELVKELICANVFEYQQGHSYKHFNNFIRDPLRKLDMSNKLASGTNAR